MMVNRIVGYIVRAIKALREAPSLTEFHCYWHSFFLQKLLLTFRSLFLDDIENVSECSNIFIINRALSYWNIQLNDFVTTEVFNVIIHLYSGIQLDLLSRAVTAFSPGYRAGTTIPGLKVEPSVPGHRAGIKDGPLVPVGNTNRD